MSVEPQTDRTSDEHRPCPRCSYDLAGLPASHTCPECGFVYDEDMLVAQGWDSETRPTRSNLIWTLCFTTVLAVVFGRRAWQSRALGWGTAIGFVFLGLTAWALYAIIRNMVRKHQGDTEVSFAFGRDEIMLFGVEASELRIPWTDITKYKLETDNKRWKLTFTTNAEDTEYGSFDLELDGEPIVALRSRFDRAVRENTQADS
ncbi:MAG: hypothetical protein AAF432_10950 [Planctomycetota bacterium]